MFIFFFTYNANHNLKCGVAFFSNDKKFNFAFKQARPNAELLGMAVCGCSSMTSAYFGPFWTPPPVLSAKISN